MKVCSREVASVITVITRVPGLGLTGHLTPALSPVALIASPARLARRRPTPSSSSPVTRTIVIRHPSHLRVVIVITRLTPVAHLSPRLIIIVVIKSSSRPSRRASHRARARASVIIITGRLAPVACTPVARARPPSSSPSPVTRTLVIIIIIITVAPTHPFIIITACHHLLSPVTRPRLSSVIITVIIRTSSCTGRPSPAPTSSSSPA